MTTIITTSIATMFLTALVSFGQEVQPLKLGQMEIGGALGVTHIGSNETKAGININGGVTLHPNFSIIGDYTFTPLGTSRFSASGVSQSSNAKFHIAQGGGRVNLLARGRAIPYVVGTAGVLRSSAAVSISNRGTSYSYGNGSNKLAFGVGGGVLLRVTRHLDFKLDARGYKGKDMNWIQEATLGFGFRS